MRQRNKKILHYNPPVGLSSVKHRQIVSEVSNILARLEPARGYSSPWPVRDDEAAIREVLEYLRSEGINTGPSGLGVYSPKGNKRR